MQQQNEEMPDSVSRHKRAGDILLDALQRPPAERLRFVSDVCAADAVMLQEVLSLLEAHARSDGFLNTAIMDTATTPIDSGWHVLACPKCGLCVEVLNGIAPHECPNDRTPLGTALGGAAVIDGKYRIERCLGRGGMGAVYQVRHVGLEKRFALKLIHASQLSNDTVLSLFSQEAKALGRLKHPNIVDVTDYGVDPRGLPYLVTELLDGQTLENYCKAEGPLRPVPIEQAMPILESIAQAIDFVHKNGLLHRDIKLANIFLSDTPKLVDFGLAAFAAQDTQVLAGTPEYMAPEIYKTRTATTASDLYAFGVVAYAVLTGSMPFQGKDMGTLLEAHCSATPARPSQALSELDTEYDAPLLRMLAKDPAERPSTALEAVEQIRAAWLAARRRRWKETEIPRRMRLAGAAVPVLAFLCWVLSLSGLVQRAEARLADWRFAGENLRPPNEQLLLVLVDEPSLAADPSPLAGRAAEFAECIDRLFAARARTVGVDLLLPGMWSRSPEFSRTVLQHAQNLKLAVLSNPDGTTTGSEVVQGLTMAALGQTGMNRLFAFTNLEHDIDGGIRHARLAYADRAGGRRATLAAAVVGKDGGPERFWIDQSADVAKFRRISWKDVPSTEPRLFRGRIVLIGADYNGSGDGDHRMRPNGPLVSGVTLQAVIADTILAGCPVRDANLMSTVILAGVLGAFVFAAGAIFWRRRLSWGVAACAGGLVLLSGLVAFRWGGIMILIAAPLATVMIAALAGMASWRLMPGFPAE